MIWTTETKITIVPIITLETIRTITKQCKIILSIISAPVVYVYGCGWRYKDAFTSLLCRRRPQLVAGSAARPRRNPLRGSTYKAGVELNHTMEIKIWLRYVFMCTTLTCIHKDMGHFYFPINWTFVLFWGIFFISLSYFLLYAHSKNVFRI